VTLGCKTTGRPTGRKLQGWWEGARPAKKCPPRGGESGADSRRYRPSARRPRHAASISHGDPPPLSQSPDAAPGGNALSAVPPPPSLGRQAPGTRGFPPPKGDSLFRDGFREEFRPSGPRSLPPSPPPAIPPPGCPDKPPSECCTQALSSLSLIPPSGLPSLPLPRAGGKQKHQ